MKEETKQTTTKKDIKINLSYPESVNDAVTEALVKLGFEQYDLNSFAYKGVK